LSKTENFHQFDHWEDPLLKSSKREINLKADMVITAYYKEVSGVGKITFVGDVSAQDKEGETVTLTITKPDSSTIILTTTTKADLTFTLEYEDTPADGYKAKARIEEDVLYEAAESSEITFSIGKAPRTITIHVA